MARLTNGNKCSRVVSDFGEKVESAMDFLGLPFDLHKGTYPSMDG